MSRRGRSADTSGSASSSLLRRVQSRDASAWWRLVKLYGPVVYAWARGAGLQAADATDVVQEVFAAVWQSIEQFRRDRPEDSFRGWLWTIARNKIRDRFRRLRHQPQAHGGTAAQEILARLPEQPPATSPGQSGLQAGSGLVHRALELVRAEFEESTWQAFWRTAVDGRSPAGVAEELGMTLHAVYKAKSRVLQRLRHELEGLDLYE